LPRNKSLTAELIALEHACWCRSKGMKWREILESIGVMDKPNLDRTIRALAIAWINLPKHGRY